MSVGIEQIQMTYNRYYKDKAKSSRRTGSAKQMALEDIVEKITECDMAGAEAEADYWSDLKACKESLTIMPTLIMVRI